jgi:hypothetical protein
MASLTLLDLNGSTPFHVAKNSIRQISLFDSVQACMQLLAELEEVPCLQYTTLHAREMAFNEINTSVLIYDISCKVRTSMLCVEWP